MKWRRRFFWLLSGVSLVCTMALVEYVMRPQPAEAPPQELYTVVQKHVAACRSADFPQAYHTATNRVQEKYTLEQWQSELRRDYRDVVGTDRIEFGEVRHFRADARKAAVDVYFVTRHGEALAWTYLLVFEDGDWKVDHGEPMPNWSSGQRLNGMRL